MGQYLESSQLADVPAIVDLVDVDSQKWFDYAATAGSLKRRLFELEGRRVRRLEKRLSARANAVTVVSDAEAKLLRSFCPDAPVKAVGNGVDLAYFSPSHASTDIGNAENDNNGPKCVFVGALDYRANVDGVCWFCQDVWPIVRGRNPGARLTLVGRKPVSSIHELAQRQGVRIAADVPDVRPYLAGADVVVVPLKIARGVQNKVLEAAAMGKTIVASPQALEGLEFVPNEHVCSADDPQQWSETVLGLFGDPDRRRQLGQRAYDLVRNRYNWESRLSPLETILAGNVPAWPSTPPTSVDSSVGGRLTPCLAAS
jgi:sugar transferase (PEP-CTERM/EpsH1 system associated)